MNIAADVPEALIMLGEGYKGSRPLGEQFHCYKLMEMVTGEFVAGGLNEEGLRSCYDWLAGAGWKFVALLGDPNLVWSRSSQLRDDHESFLLEAVKWVPAVDSLGERCFDGSVRTNSVFGDPSANVGLKLSSCNIAVREALSTFGIAVDHRHVGSVCRGLEQFAAAQPGQTSKK